MTGGPLRRGPFSLHSLPVHTSAANSLRSSLDPSDDLFTLAPVEHGEAKSASGHRVVRLSSSPISQYGAIAAMSTLR